MQADARDGLGNPSQGTGLFAMGLNRDRRKPHGPLLQGNWRLEHLFALKQALDAFDFVGTQLAERDREIELQLRSLKLHDGEPANGKKHGRVRNASMFDLRTQLFQMCGVDLHHIDGIDVNKFLTRRPSSTNPWRLQSSMSTGLEWRPR